METNSPSPSSPLPESRARVKLFSINLSHINQFHFALLAIFFVFLTLAIPATSVPAPVRPVSYAKFCNDIVPESSPTDTRLDDGTLLRFRPLYFTGGDSILGQKNHQFDSNFRKSVNFEPKSVYKTEANGILRVEGMITFFGPKLVGFSGNLTRRRLRLVSYWPPRIPVRRRGVMFRLRGYWSETSGKLCMVGSGLNHLRSVEVVLKLNYNNASVIDTSLVTGTLESLDASDGLNHFEPISLLGLTMRNYQYKLVDGEIAKRVFSGFDEMESVSLGLESQNSICSVFKSAGRFELDYMNDCNSINCSPFGRDGGLPGFMSLKEIDCTNWKGRYLLEFWNSSLIGYQLAFDPNTTLVAEGKWNKQRKHLDLAACRLNVTVSMAKASLEDCSIRLSMRFPSTLSLRNRSRIIGQMWSSKSTSDSGYFGKVGFWSPRNGHARVGGVKYEYTMIDAVRKSCARKITDKHKAQTYPDGYSSDMRFDMTVRNSKGQNAWGYASPFSVGDKLYGPSLVYTRQPKPAGQANNTVGDILNMSYVISFTLPPDFKLGGIISPPKPFQISAEGIYDAKSGVLCMIGCQPLESLNKVSGKDESFDCEIRISIQYHPVNAKDIISVKGTIESNRSKSDSLYFEPFELFSSSIFTSQAKESIWRMDLEIVMVLISNTLACIFVGWQLYYVNKYPDVLPFISVVMLAVLTLAHMIPLLLNFEALFLANRNRQNLFLGSGGWLELNEVLVRVITMVAFLLEFRLLQRTWSARADDETRKRLRASDKKVLCLSLPLYISGALIAWFVHEWKYSYKNPMLKLRHLGYKQQSFWQDLKSYAGLILDGFQLPQIVFNIFCSSREKALSLLSTLGLLLFVYCLMHMIFTGLMLLHST
ncbi:hypothetical protein NMG60_11012719 [Bertholletia excelsa]